MFYAPRGMMQFYGMAQTFPPERWLPWIFLQMNLGVGRSKAEHLVYLMRISTLYGIDALRRQSFQMTCTPEIERSL